MVQPLDDARRRRRPPGGDGSRVPPHNLQAEESLLGAMLLSRDAIVAAVEVQLGPDDFYKPAYGHIYEAITSLYARGEPADPVTVADELRRAGLAELVGGPNVLVSLQANTPAIGNAGRYARIVEEHALLRRLIAVAGDIAEMGYSVPEDIAATVDTAEALIFDVAQRRVTDSMASIRDLLERHLDHIEALYERGQDITGVPTGYVDLDQQLAGLQPANLVIVGGRPGTGKTSFALGMAAHAALEARSPVLFMSLEMSHLELTQRMLCSEARVDATRMRNGRLLESDWPKISHAVGRLAEAPIFIDDNPHLTVMEIRAKARRLKSRSGLGLIVVDYLQLMTGRSNAENRQVEVSEISRGLKILARELSVPVIALSQLSRSLETRADKRPVLADLRESGCMPADTRLVRADTGAEVTLGELVLTGARDVPVWSVDEHGRLVPARLSRAFPSGVKPVFEMRLASGRAVEATGNHPFRVGEGWRRLDQLAVGDRIAVPRRLHDPLETQRLDEDEIVLLAHLLGGGCVLPRQSVHYTSVDPENLDTVEEAAGRRFGVSPRRVRQANGWHSYLPSPFPLAGGRHDPIQEWWAQLGLFDRRSHEQSVPERIHQLPTDQVALFLRHLWATAGSLCVGKRSSGPPVTVYYASTSRPLIEGVRRLLLRLDIGTKAMTVDEGRHRPGYRLAVDGVQNLRRFLTLVGVHGRRGRSVPAALEALGVTVGSPNVGTIPRRAGETVVAAMPASGVTQRRPAGMLPASGCGSYFLGSTTSPRRMGRERVGGVAEPLEDAAMSDVTWDRIVSIAPVGAKPVFDATVEGTHNFIANGLVAHNSLEQDADVVIFLYRDEVYNRDSPDRGTAEVIVAKHRNGPTGVTQLAFLDHYTRFANMAKGV